MNFYQETSSTGAKEVRLIQKHQPQLSGTSHRSVSSTCLGSCNCAECVMHFIQLLGSLTCLALWMTWSCGKEKKKAIIITGINSIKYSQVLNYHLQPQYHSAFQKILSFPKASKLNSQFFISALSIEWPCIGNLCVNCRCR